MVAAAMAPAIACGRLPCKPWPMSWACGWRFAISHRAPASGTKSKHRLFSFITKNWRGRPLTSYQVIVNLIAHTTTKAGLVVRAALDKARYETGIVVSDEELASVKMIPAKFHGEWNYAVCPK